MEKIKLWVPGVMVTLAISLVAQYLASYVPIMGSLVIAILIGTIIGNISKRRIIFEPGNKLITKQGLELSVALLGLEFNFAYISQIGDRIFLIITLCIILGIIVSYLLGRWMGLNKKIAFLIAIGNSICGNSAIAAAAPLVKANKKEITISIALTGLMGVLIVILLPLLNISLHLSNYQYGVLAGTTVYAVPQVVAASFTISDLSGKVGILVKMVRVLFIGPLILLLSCLQGGEGKKAFYLPWFIISFLLLALLNTYGVIPFSLISLVTKFNQILMVMAMAGMGLEVNFLQVRQTGFRVAITVLSSILFIGCLSYTLIKILIV